MRVALLLHGPVSKLESTRWRATWDACLFIGGFVPALVFGVAVTLVALYEGWQAKPTPEGVARATTRTVVMASLAVLALYFLLTALMFSV